jgi:hypothetical protein
MPEYMLSPLFKRGAKGDFGLDHIPSNRNIFMTTAIIQKERAATDHPSVAAHTSGCKEYV